MSRLKNYWKQPTICSSQSVHVQFWCLVSNGKTCLGSFCCQCFNGAMDSTAVVTDRGQCSVSQTGFVTWDIHGEVGQGLDDQY